MDNLNQEVEFAIEESHLGYVIEQLKEERLKELEKRIKISNLIIDHRKKTLEAYEDDEDRVAEYFDHESYVMEETFKSIDKTIQEITTLMPAPYFGRIDLREEDSEEDKLYIGRFGVMNKEKFEPIIVDWRAPIASTFYNGTLGETTYMSPDGEVSVNVLLKRQFIIKQEKLKGMFDSAIDVKDEILQSVLSKNSSDKLKDIVMTIQREQDEIIRRPRNSVVVVNGVAGSGKTTIALHRVAYLLYNNREVLKDKMLILGPNYIFMEYIRDVLPTLGESGIDQMTFVDFALNLLNFDRDQLMSFDKYMEKIVDNDKEFIEVMKKKTSEAFIEELDNLIKNMDENAEVREVKYFDNVVQSVDDIKDMLYNHFKTMPLYRRKKKIKRIIFSKLRDARNERVWDIERKFKETVESLSEDDLKLQINNLEYKKTLDIREAVMEVINVKKTLIWLDNIEVEEIYEPYKNGDLYTIDDLAPLLYLRIKLEGIKLEKEIKHVVIDEAQDYSKLQFIVVKEITEALGLTIVGDSNQRITPIEGIIPMESIEEIYNDCEDIEKFSLNKSYRSTKEIMEYANSYLEGEKIVPLVRSGNKVKVEDVESKEELVDTLKEAIMDMEDAEMETVAIITKNREEAEELSTLLEGEGLKLYDKEEMIYRGGYIIIPSYLSKGLEFDGVIVVEQGNEESKLSYVMSTRALHNLRVVRIANN